MARYIGLDLGTTSITALILDTERREILVKQGVDNDTQRAAPKGRSEWDIDRMVGLSLELLSALAQTPEGRSVAAIGVTGQMHGMALLDAQANPLQRFIGWQDQRCHERLPNGQTYLSQMATLAETTLGRTGCRLATGYMASTLFWLKQNALLPDGAQACFAPDYLVSRLCNQAPVTDATNAASAGVYDVINGQWDTATLNALGLPVARFPEVKPSCSVAGGLARDIGLSEGLPVTVACGDNQASFAGSVADYSESVLVNIGTGGQISLFVNVPILTEALDLRPFLQGGYLLVGAGLCGGRSYRALRDFMKHVGEAVFGVSDVPDLYERLNALASDVPPGSDGLHCEPIFTGSRREPNRRGVWSGISETNFTPGHLARSLLEGLAEQFSDFYKEMQALGVQRRAQLIGAGNGVRKNALLQQILAETFSLPLRVAHHTEEAAVGAALCAAVAVGEFADIQAASRGFIRY